MPEDERLALEDEINGPKWQICPNITDFEIMQGDEENEVYFSVAITAKSDDKDLIEGTIVQGTNI